MSEKLDAPNNIGENTDHSEEEESENDVPLLNDTPKVSDSTKERDRNSDSQNDPELSDVHCDSSKIKTDHSEEEESVNEDVPRLNDIPEISNSTKESDRNSDNQNDPQVSDAHCDPSNVHYEGDLAIYTDSNTGSQYQWDKEKKEWVIRNNVVYGFEDDTHVYTDSEGSKYFWDKEKNAWFPKIDEDFMARYQMSYGFIDNTKVEVKKPQEPNVHVQEQKQRKVKGEKRKASEPTWFEVDETQNTSVYVSHLPTDMDDQEFVDLMQKCGLVMRDPQSGDFKIKLYKERGTDILKGDALCTYIRVESVDLALNLLDGYDYKGHKLKVERAKFQMKGDFDPKLKPKMKKKKDKIKLKKQQEKLFDWRPEKQLGDRAKHERIVIVKNLFDPSLFDTEVGLILEFQEDLREECSKLGEVRKVIIYDRHPEGVAQINMSSPEEAEQVVELLNDRWFMKRKLSAEISDGRTKYKIAETDSEITQRIDNWDKFLEGEENKAGDVKNEETAINSDGNVDSAAEEIVNSK